MVPGRPDDLFLEAHALPKNVDQGLALLKLGELDLARRRRMNAANPWILPRNWVVQEVIDRAEAGDPSGIEALLDVLRRPYMAQPAHARIAGRRPEWARNKAGCSALSCSS